MHRGGAIVAEHAQVGEGAAMARLDAFCGAGIDGYKSNRDVPSMIGTSNLSENLSLGEISPGQCWHAGLIAMHQGKAGAETFLKELVWREFAYHLMYHTPHILVQNWREGWDAFPWCKDAEHPHFVAWTQGRTGVPLVDAAMREMYVTGRMHNRGRMIVASYLTKHLMCHWRLGQSWFEECLTDWDPASNAMGWQWSAGSGPDATPYFRIFNPVSQQAKFDPLNTYVDRWIAEGKNHPSRLALSYFDAIPKAWNLAVGMPYPDPIVPLAEGRKRALDAYSKRDF